MKRIKVDDDTHAAAKVAAAQKGQTLEEFTRAALTVHVRVAKAAEGFTRKRA